MVNIAGIKVRNWRTNPCKLSAKSWPDAAARGERLCYRFGGARPMPCTHRKCSLAKVTIFTLAALTVMFLLVYRSS